MQILKIQLFSQIWDVQFMIIHEFSELSRLSQELLMGLGHIGSGAAQAVWWRWRKGVLQCQSVFIKDKRKGDLHLKFSDSL